ncbi:MAG TPA: hypothetical protein VFF69_07030 [Phycisphaerales bacterium]|nr:hypothetical protein [Phycisphaerales bacterium]
MEPRNEPGTDGPAGELVDALRDLLGPAMRRSEPLRRAIRALGEMLRDEADRAAPELPRHGAPVVPAEPLGPAAPEPPSATTEARASPIAGPRIVKPEPAREVPLRLGDTGAVVRVFGRPEEIERAYTSAQQQFEEDGYAPPRPIEPRVIAQRAALKAESCRLFVQRRAAAGDESREPALIAAINRLLDRARELPECFLWVVFPGREQPGDEMLGLIADWYDALSESAALIATLDAEPSRPRAWIEAAMQTFAHASAGLRVALGQTWLTRPDVDQDDAHLWLRWRTKAAEVLVPRYMRLDDPPELASVSELRAAIASLLREAEERSHRAASAERHLKRVRYHAEQIGGGRAIDPGHDWRRIDEALRELALLGVPPSHPRVAAALKGVQESAAPAPPEFAHASAAFAARGQEPARAEPGAGGEPEWSERVLEVRELLRGRAIVVIGGEPRQDAANRLRDAFALDRVEWVPLTEHGSGAPMRAPIMHPDTLLVLVLVKLAGHLHAGEAREYCRQAGKPLVMLQAGYNPEQVAYAVLGQASNQLRPAG